MASFFESIWNQLGGFVPSLLGAIAILIVGWIVATVVASGVKGLLKRTEFDNRLANWLTGGRPGDTSPPIETWIATTVYWLIMAFVLVAFLRALNLEIVSQPLNDFLQQIFGYLPRVGGAVVLLGIAWLLATLSKVIVTRGLQRFNLDDKLAAQTGTSVEDSPFLVNETLANALYWFIFLFFLPFILDTLNLQGPLEPVQGLLDQILSALPKILKAVIIGVIGWLIARIVRGVVTNMLAAMGADRIGSRVGLNQSTGTLSLSSLAGTVTYVLILIPTAIAALRALEISAISDPAVSMLDQIMAALPKIFTAALILVVFYVLGRFVADLVTSLLSGMGFDNIFSLLGFATPATPVDATPGEEPAETPALATRTPSEIIGILVLVGIMLVAAVAATEVLQFEQLTAIVNGILKVSGQVLVGVIVFAVGLYFANLAFNIITSSGGRQARILGQTARISIITLVSAMALQQMGIATNIVNLAFGLLLGSIAVAIAIAFGLGGRDVAAEQLRDWIASFKRN
jgi:hypothetical protein